MRQVCFRLVLVLYIIENGVVIVFALYWKKVVMSRHCSCVRRFAFGEGIRTWANAMWRAGVRQVRYGNFFLRGVRITAEVMRAGKHGHRFCLSHFASGAITYAAVDSVSQGACARSRTTYTNLSAGGPMSDIHFKKEIIVNFFRLGM